MKTEGNSNMEIFHYSLLTLKVSLPSMHHNISIYSPQMGDGGSNSSISQHMEGQGS